MTLDTKTYYYIECSRIQFDDDWYRVDPKTSDSAAEAKARIKMYVADNVYNPEHWKFRVVKATLITEVQAS